MKVTSETASEEEERVTKALKNTALNDPVDDGDDDMIRMAIAASLESAWNENSNKDADEDSKGKGNHMERERE
jgi:hypothetical protein